MGLPASLAPRHLVLVFTLLLAAAQAGPPLTDPPDAPFLIDTSATFFWTDSQTAAPAAASNGAVYLVVWQDRRNSNWDIYAARMRPDGSVVESDGIRVCTSVGAQQNPVVASDGNGFLVVWEDQRSGMRWNIYAARLDSGGRVIDTAGIAVRLLNGDKHSPAVAYCAGRYFVTWDEYYGSRNIVAAFVDTAGAVGEGIEICALPGIQGSPSVAFGDSLFLVTWDDARNGARSAVYAARLNESGVLLDTGGFPVMVPHNAQTLPSVAYDGANFLVTWQESPLANDDILGVRIAPSGAVLDTAAIRISAADGDQLRPRAVFADSQYFVIWEDMRGAGGTAPDVYCARVSPSGVVAEPSGLRVCAAEGPQSGPALAWGSDRLLGVWQDNRTSSFVPGVYGARVTSGGLLLDTASILVGTHKRKVHVRQDSPNLAYGDNAWLVVWSAFSPDTLHPDVYAMRVGSSGRPLDISPIRVGDGQGDDKLPCVASDGTDWLVVWLGPSLFGTDVFARRISRSGVVLDTSAIALTATGKATGAPGIVFDGLNYLVAWTETRPVLMRIYGRRVSPAGVVLDTADIPISVRAASVNPMLASGDSWSLVVWQDSGSSYWHIHAARVSRAGVVIDNYPAQLGPGTGCENPAVARNEDQYLVTWIDRPTGSHGVFGVLLRWPGQYPETTLVTILEQNYWYTRAPVAFDSRDYYVAYRFDVSEIWCTQVTPFGGVTGPYPLVAGLQDGYPGNMAAGANGSMLLVYATTTDSVNGYPANCWRIWGLLSVRFVGVAESGEPAQVKSPLTLSLTGVASLQGPGLSFLVSGVDPTGTVEFSDVLGRSVRRYVTCGSGPLTWDLRDGAGRRVSTGLYFARLTCGRETTVRKLVLVD